MASVSTLEKTACGAGLLVPVGPLCHVLKPLPKATDDDWSGLKDAAERRKRQNRLNVRAHRQRKLAQTAQPQIVSKTGCLNDYSAAEFRTKRDRVSVGVHEGNPWLLTACEPVRRWNFIDMRLLLNPLPDNQRLRMLIAYNTARAVATNMKILQISSVTVAGDCRLVRGDIDLFPTPATAPESLMATSSQRSIPHEPWIDLLPHPRFRDNLIRLADQYDQCEFLSDCAGGAHDDGAPCVSENAGMLVWAEPWHARGWEMTETFVRKWAFLLEGCEELVEASNAWRAIRGEEPIIIDL